MADELAALYGRLYLDQDVPVQLAGMLRAQGVDVLTTLEAGALGQDDPDQSSKRRRRSRAFTKTAPCCAGSKPSGQRVSLL
jgi:hypothetical protein